MYQRTLSIRIPIIFHQLTIRLFLRKDVSLARFQLVGIFFFLFILFYSIFITIKKRTRNKADKILQINGKGRRRRGARIRSVDEELQQKRDELIKIRVARKARRHHHGEEHVMKISLRQTKHRMRIIKLQPAIKVIYKVYPL